MAVQIITKINCDLHLLMEDPEEVDAGTVQVIIPTGQIRELDLCDECQGIITYRQIIELAASDTGRDAEEEEQPSTPRRRKSKSSADLDADVACTAEDCDRMFTSQQGLSMHLRRSHPDDVEARRKALEQAGDGGDIIVCNECDPPGMFLNEKSYDQHRRTQHPAGQKASTEDTGTRITSTDAEPEPAQV